MGQVAVDIEKSEAIRQRSSIERARRGDCVAMVIEAMERLERVGYPNRGFAVFMPNTESREWGSSVVLGDLNKLLRECSPKEDLPTAIGVISRTNGNKVVVSSSNLPTEQIFRDSNPQQLGYMGIPDSLNDKANHTRVFCTYRHNGVTSLGITKAAMKSPGTGRRKHTPDVPIRGQKEVAVTPRSFSLTAWKETNRPQSQDVPINFKNNFAGFVIEGVAPKEPLTARSTLKVFEVIGALSEHILVREYDMQGDIAALKSIAILQRDEFDLNEFHTFVTHTAENQLRMFSTIKAVGAKQMSVSIHGRLIDIKFPDVIQDGVSKVTVIVNAETRDRCVLLTARVRRSPMDKNQPDLQLCTGVIPVILRLSPLGYGLTDVTKWAGLLENEAFATALLQEVDAITDRNYFVKKRIEQ